ncbi:COX15/CtaA family protein [Nonlabens marinus]|uniref:Heme A synthase, cytochrome oxidase biogenesis protein Cox15-CtaA n=1 Tax=Nonlabens marinus S1-08 TaxID=1454201 RepID=W8VSY4_9FLAO|nr:COX15/CtaA family protein [Nonlabens marinus]BAO56615.1 heme A synthase, cytochrome oxidase biogenesis protein Cox15-CtaA [Nonlabens marinus S1-08]
MFTEQNYRRWLRLSILVIYLIIIAGAVVRMTGSGMGCPDWPKCFGYWIPPTEEAELEFSPNTSYKEGMVIIVDQELRVAKESFFSTTSYSESDWKPYTKHDYAVFNKFHTWTEYINRLIGALGGLVVLVAAFLSLQFIKTRPKLTVLTIAALLAMLIQAVIGKIVVDTLLSPVLITIHMIVALLIVGLLIYLLYEVLPPDSSYKNQGRLPKFALLVILLTLAQVALGTQVRQFIDHQVDLFGYPLSSEWLENGPALFFIHRSFSILLVLIHGWFFYEAIFKWNHPIRSYYTLGVLIIGTIISGILMNYADFPFGSQAVHLVLASLILGLQFYIWMRLRSARIDP